MKTLFITLILLTLSIFYGCKKHPEFKVCFTVENPTMTLGDTVRIRMCATPGQSSCNWDMGDGTTYNTNYSNLPKHIYQANGTYTIKLSQNEHHEAIVFHKRKTEETQQMVTIQ